jgi:hypothetical protein
MYIFNIHIWTSNQDPLLSQHSHISFIYIYIYMYVYLAGGFSPPETSWRVLISWDHHLVVFTVHGRKWQLLETIKDLGPYYHTSSVQSSDLRLRWWQRLSPNPPARSGCPGRQELSSSHYWFGAGCHWGLTKSESLDPLVTQNWTGWWFQSLWKIW